MSPYVAVLRSEATPLLKDFPKVKADDRHNIQTHVAYLDLLVSRNAHHLLPPLSPPTRSHSHLIPTGVSPQRKAQMLQSSTSDLQMSPVAATAAVLTPPSSTEKPANP